MPGLVGNLGQAARLIAALIIVTAAAPAAAADFTLIVQHDGSARTALAHVPADVGRALPVVVDFRAVNPLPGLLGPPTKVLDANEEIWRFFERFTR